MTPHLAPKYAHYLANAVHGGAANANQRQQQFQYQVAHILLDSR